MNCSCCTVELIPLGPRLTAVSYNGRRFASIEVMQAKELVATSRQLYFDFGTAKQEAA